MQYSGWTTWNDSGRRDSQVLHKKPDGRRRRNLCDDRAFLRIITGFLEHVCAGGGGGG